MLQRRLKHNVECKVVVFNYKSRFIASRTGSRPSLRSYDDNQILLFAEQAVVKLRENIPYCISDGLVRVDIFTETSSGIVINEFESLEANWHSKADSTVIEMNSDLTIYWTNILIDALKGED